MFYNDGIGTRSLKCKLHAANERKRRELLWKISIVKDLLGKLNLLRRN
jgi:hypothetical protein